MILMMLVWVFVLGAVAWLVWRGVRGGGGGAGFSRGDSAEEILKQRYARGEIDRGTYERMLDDLRADRERHERPAESAV